MSSSKSEKFAPAIGFRFLTKYYDVLVNSTLDVDTILGRFADQIALKPGMNLLDVGCGTGNLLFLLHRLSPDAKLHGMDIDPEMISMAKEKARKAGLNGNPRIFQNGADELDFPSNSLDRVVSSLALHHLSRDVRRKNLRQSYEILKPGGEIHILDWGKPEGAFHFIGTAFELLTDGYSGASDVLFGRIPRLLSETGFADIVELDPYRAVFGTLHYYKAVKPVSPLETDETNTASFNHGPY